MMARVDKGTVRSLQTLTVPSPDKISEQHYITDNEHRALIKEWIELKVPNNPLYCGKYGTRAVMHGYIIDLYRGAKVDDLPLTIGSSLNTVSRLKNKFLKANPTLDLRPQKKPKIEHTKSLFDEL